MRKKLVVTGDVYINGEDPGRLLAPVASVIRETDCAIANFEAPASDRGEPNHEKTAYGSLQWMRMPPSAVDAVKDAGFHLVSLANNHALDYGPDALVDTMDLLDKAGIGHAGAGYNLDQARKPAIFTVGTTRIALLSVTFVYFPMTFPATEDRLGVYCIKVDTSYTVPRNLALAPGVWPQAVSKTDEAGKAMLLSDVKKAREEADIVVVACHWGISGNASSTAMKVPLNLAPTFVTDYQHEMGRAIIDAGASLVIGNHAHKMQPMEFYNDGLILYSLGNLAFGKVVKSNAHFGRVGGLVKAEIDQDNKTLGNFSMVPLMMSADPYLARVAVGSEAQSVYEQVQDLCDGYNVNMTLQSDEIILSPR